MDAEKLVEDLAGRVRDALSDAESRAREIVDAAEQRAQKLVTDAEAEAQRIRERAEVEADERLTKVREALSGLEGALGDSGAREPASEVDPRPPSIPEPTPQPMPEPTPPAEPEPMPPAEPEPMPPSPEIEPPPPPQPDRQPPTTEAANGAGRGSAVGARIVATKMALDGSTREEIAAHLATNYDVENPEALLDAVMARAAR